MLYDLLEIIPLEIWMEIGQINASCIEFCPCKMVPWTLVTLRPGQNPETLEWERVPGTLRGNKDRNAGVADVAGPASPNGTRRGVSRIRVAPASWGDGA